ncbi:MAG: methyl-accepting chemotaxis protein [Verrucomicrobiae bacterium]|nr:methyl-accepting chemotaxis protein [Verrucomicrobiae bacterium]NNJ42673.1 methyl-accepting chemotaxis protein [Akkermansiaceae bacterium]
MKSSTKRFDANPLKPTLDQSMLRWTFGAVFVGMLAYPLAEYFIDRPTDGMTFFTHHLLHVLVNGIVVWIALVSVIRRAVVEPASRIFVHLQRVASGRLEYLDCEVQSREVGDVVASINSLIETLKRIPAPDSASRAMDRVRELRGILKQNTGRLGDDIVPAMRILTFISPTH